MAVDIFVTIAGQKQGQFKGQSQDQAFQGKGAMEIQNFTSGFSNPRTIGDAHRVYSAIIRKSNAFASTPPTCFLGWTRQHPGKGHPTQPYLLTSPVTRRLGSEPRAGGE